MMAEDAPPPPSPRTKPRPRSQIFAPSTSADQSPSLSRSYRQPVGTGSLRRSQAASGSHTRSRSVGDGYEPGASFAGTSESGGTGLREVFCDLVVQGLEIDEHGRCVHPTGPIVTFIDSLGAPLPPADDDSASKRPISRPSTPGPPARADPEKVRRSLHELWATEESYLRKIISLQQDYAQPLRQFSKKRETAVIPAFEATHLFGNIDQIVPISQAFEKDLGELVRRAQMDRSRAPAGFGEVILQHVERMTPYKKWLANVSASEAIRRELEKQSSFREFVERTQVHSRETARTTGGFKEFLAEPFQRVSRYRLMIDPMIQHLEPEDPNVEPLQLASRILGDICSMEIDGATRRAATFWSLKETIDGFPDSLIDFDRRLLAVLDADEVVELAEARPTTLRCTLFLFDDKLLIAKRPSGDKQGKVHAGVDDLDQTVALYQTSHLSSTQANLLGSPKKLRKGALGFRGQLSLDEVAIVDLGGQLGREQFGLAFDRAPPNQSERWAGRPTRQFVVAGTYAPDTQRAEKAVWLEAFATASLHGRVVRGAMLAKRSLPLSAAGFDGMRSRLNWAIWDQARYAALPIGQRNKLAMLVTTDPAVSPLAKPATLRPKVSVTLTMLDSERSRVEVFSTDSPGGNADIVENGKVAGAIANISSSYGLYNFPSIKPLAAGSARSRTRSNLLSVLDVFSSGGGLKRGNSLVSKGSSTATTTVDSPSLSRPSPRFDASTPPRKRPVAQHSVPDFSRSVGASTNYAFVPTPEPDSAKHFGSSSLRSNRTRPRRSISLPPPPTSAERSQSSSAYDSGAPSPGNTTTCEVEDEPEDHDDLMESIAVFADAGSLAPAPDTTAAVNHASPSPRRRMMGPRDMRSSERAGTESPGSLPFARNHSPSPVRHEVRATSAVTVASRTQPESLSSTFGVTKRSRSQVGPSPRPTPAKKMAPTEAAHTSESSGLEGIPRKLFQAEEGAVGRSSTHSALETTDLRPDEPRAGSASRTDVRAAVEPHEEQLPDMFSPTRKVLPCQAPIPFYEDATMHEVTQPPFERLHRHIDDMRLKLARQLVSANKENDCIVSPTALTRSPQTRNVFGKALQGDGTYASPSSRLSKIAAPAGEARDAPQSRYKIDHLVLSEWTRRLADLVDECEDGFRRREDQTAPDRSESARALEVFMLEQERDLLADELAKLKADMEELRRTEQGTQSRVTTLQLENGKLRQAYLDICAEADALHSDFNAALESVHLAAQAEPTATDEHVELTAQLTEVTSLRFKAEHDLRVYRRQIASEMAEKERWGNLLRAHGLLP